MRVNRFAQRLAPLRRSESTDCYQKVEESRWHSKAVVLLSVQDPHTGRVNTFFSDIQLALGQRG